MELRINRARLVSVAPTKRINDFQKIVLKKFTIVKLFVYSTHCFHSITSKQYFTVYFRLFRIVFHAVFPLYFTPYFTLLLPSATKLQRLCFYRCLSVHGGGLPVHPGIHPLGRHSPWTETPPHPADGYCSSRRLLLRTVRLLLECILVVYFMLCFTLYFSFHFIHARVVSCCVLCSVLRSISRSISCSISRCVSDPSRHARTADFSEDRRFRRCVQSANWFG